VYVKRGLWRTPLFPLKISNKLKKISYGHFRNKKIVYIRMETEKEIEKYNYGDEKYYKKSRTSNLVIEEMILEQLYPKKKNERVDRNEIELFL